MRGFDSVETWIFDLDNTLYPASCRLFDQMHQKMGQYVMARFGVDFAEARRIQKELFYKHGTTLRGLMQEHGEHPDGFLDMVHDIDYSPVPHSPDLDRELGRLPGRKLVFTAGTCAHAARVLDRLGIADQFEGVFDIVAADYVPKPARAPYDQFLQIHGVDPASAAFFEDIARNLQVPHDMGMTTVLVTSDEHPDADALNHDADAPYVHHQTNNLAAFLAAQTETRS
jgi:putative hydrolase of the HAD superfamily